MAETDVCLKKAVRQCRGARIAIMRHGADMRMLPTRTGY